MALGGRWPEHWDSDDLEVDFFDVKADLEAVLQLGRRADETRFSPAEHPALSPGQSAKILVADDPVGWLGALHPQLQRQLDFKSTVILFALQLEKATRASIPKYEAYSKFPSVRRDIAFVIGEDVSSEQVIACARESAGKLLQDITLFDIYRGIGIDSRRKSIALGLILQDTSRTLTDADADRAVASVTQRLERALGATIRK